MNKGKVDVLLSLYNPDENYLEKQLKSLDNQTYTNMKILIYDDCVENRCSLSFIEKCIKKKAL